MLQGYCCLGPFGAKVIISSLTHTENAPVVSLRVIKKMSNKFQQRTLTIIFLFVNFCWQSTT